MTGVQTCALPISSLCNIAVLTVRAAVLGAVATAFTAAVLSPIIAVFKAAMFAFRLNTGFSHCFFFWECLPCPGPGMLSRETERKTKRKRKTEGLVLDSV